MATPPFSLSTITPGDSDIVSQFPLDERTLRDIIQSWLLINHDTNGNHPFITMPFQGSSPGTPSSSQIIVYPDATGRLLINYPDATVGWVGIPPGSIIYYGAASTPVGYLVSDGSAVSRSTYAALFSVIGTTYGSGDGSTTFNLPDLNGRTVVGEVGASARLSTSTLNKITIGGVGGVELQSMTAASIPTITAAGSASVNGTAALALGSQITTWGVQSGGLTLTGFVNGALTTYIPAATGTSSTTSNNTGGSSPTHKNVQPSIVLRALIKV